MRIIFSVLAAIFFLGIGTCVQANEPSLYEKIATNKQLKSLSVVCPVKLVQDEDIAFNNLTDLCESNPEFCYRKCLKDSSDHCFGLANLFNITDEDSESYSRPLYSKSCELGLASSCTNAAAGIKRVEGIDGAQCYSMTFKKTCELSDPWGCTMYAVSLIYGEGVEKDLDAALSAMRGSCRFGEDDPACSGAIQLASEIIMGDFD